MASMDTGKDSKIRAEVPWSEKYRPQTLEQVAAHKDIIDTSALLWVPLSDDNRITYVFVCMQLVNC